MLIFLDKKGLVHWLQLAYNSYEVFQAYQFEEVGFSRRNKSTALGRLLSATLGDVLVQKSSNQIYQGYLFHQIIQIIILSYPFVVSNPSHLSSSGYTPALSPALDHLLPQPNNTF